jgi:hypothetical protein
VLIHKEGFGKKRIDKRLTDNLMDFCTFEYGHSIGRHFHFICSCAPLSGENGL